MRGPTYFNRPHPKDDGRLCFHRCVSVQLLAEGRGTYLGWGRGYLPWMEEGVPTLDKGRGYLPWMGKGALPWTGGGVPNLDLGEGVPTLNGGGVPNLDGEGVPTLNGGGHLPCMGEGVPTLNGERGTYLGLGEGYLTWTWGRGYLP